MQRILVLLVLYAVGFNCQAAKQVNSPDGVWTLRRVPLKTLTGEPTEGIGVFSAAGGEAATIPVKTLNYVTGVTIRWAPDSRMAAVAERYARSALITAAWYDDQKWHSTIQEDRDLEPLLEKAAELGSKKERFKTQTAELGKWISPNTIEVHGVLGYIGDPDISYSYHMQIVPGSYTVSGVLSGGYEVGALKYSEYRVEKIPPTAGAQSAADTRYIFGQPCALNGQLIRGGRGAWGLRLNEPITVGSTDPDSQALSGFSEVTLLGFSPKGVAYLATIEGKTIKVNGTLSALPSESREAGNTVGFVLSDEIVKALEAK